MDDVKAWALLQQGDTVTVVKGRKATTYTIDDDTKEEILARGHWAQWDVAGPHDSPGQSLYCGL